MPKLVCDGIEIEIEDSGSLSLIKGLIETRDSQIAQLTTHNDEGKEYKVGDQMKKYKDMDAMYKDMMKYHDQYNDMCKKYEGMKKKSDSAEARADALESEVSKKTDSSDVAKLVMEGVKTRRSLEALAAKRLDGYTFEAYADMSNTDLKKAIVKNDGLDASKYSDEQLDVVLDVLARNDSQKENNFKKQSSVIASAQTETRLDADNELQNNLDSNVQLIENAWRGGVTSDA